MMICDADFEELFPHLFKPRTAEATQAPTAGQGVDAPRTGAAEKAAPPGSGGPQAWLAGSPASPAANAGRIVGELLAGHKVSGRNRVRAGTAGRPAHRQDQPRP